MSENGKINDKVFIEQHRGQLASSGVPEHFWPTLYQKLKDGVFDAGAKFSFCQADDEDDENGAGSVYVVVIDENGVKADDPRQIYLVDHRWTFRPESARQQLRTHPNLMDIVVPLLGLESEVEQLSSQEEKVDLVMREKWRLAQTYSISSASSSEERMPIWYLIDEFGAKIRHSDTPNFRMVPFISMLDGVAYSLLFPTKNCDHMEEVSRDYLEGPVAGVDSAMREAMKNIFSRESAHDMTHVNWHQEEPDEKFFAAGREAESLPDLNAPVTPLPTDRKIKVYAEYKVIVENLKHPRFEIVHHPADADILWLMEHFKDFKGLSESKEPLYVNQFPFEAVLTIKDLLCVVCRRPIDDGDKPNKDSSSSSGDLERPAPKWLPITFNLQTELPKFVSYFQQREKQGLDNHWIVKPWNLARALDTHVSKDLPHILKQMFSTPKIVQKYLHDPVLFERPEVGKVKFDVRYVLLLKSIAPLKVYAYDRFWLRFANRPFELNELDVYEKHFTVMNYNEDANLKQMFCHEFVKEFEAQYPDFKWKQVQQSIFQMFKDVFRCASAKEPPCGIGHCPQAGSLYAVDLMLDWDNDADGSRSMQPKLLEVNYGPDCNRACDYYPEFFDNAFSTLFLDQPEGQNVTLL